MCEIWYECFTLSYNNRYKRNVKPYNYTLVEYYVVVALVNRFDGSKHSINKEPINLIEIANNVIGNEILKAKVSRVFSL